MSRTSLPCLPSSPASAVSCGATIFRPRGTQQPACACAAPTEDWTGAVTCCGWSSSSGPAPSTMTPAARPCEASRSSLPSSCALWPQQRRALHRLGCGHLGVGVGKRRRRGRGRGLGLGLGRPAPRSLWPRHGRDGGRLVGRGKRRGHCGEGDLQPGRCRLAACAQQTTRTVAPVDLHRTLAHFAKAQLRHVLRGALAGKWQQAWLAARHAPMVAARLTRPRARRADPPPEGSARGPVRGRAPPQHAVPPAGVRARLPWARPAAPRARPSGPSRTRSARYPHASELAGGRRSGRHCQEGALGGTRARGAHPLVRAFAVGDWFAPARGP
jgi:hypothetical protein